jgi:hypothetical protein
VKAKSAEIIPKPVPSNNSTSTSNPKPNLPSASGTGSGQGTVTVGAGGGINGVLSLGGSSASSAAAILTAANTSFELTPLSGLIKQSYKDIGTLRAIQAEREKLVGVGDAGGIGGGGEKVDFDGMEEHLRRFEEVYRQVCAFFFSNSPQPVPPSSLLTNFNPSTNINTNTNNKNSILMGTQFLRYGGRHGDSQEEVHLVAILCKRSDVLSSNTSSKHNSKNGGSGSGSGSGSGNESEKKGREKDCGF